MPCARCLSGETRTLGPNNKKDILKNGLLKKKQQNELSQGGPV